MMYRSVLLVVLVAAMPSAAIAEPDELATLHSQVGFGTAIVPDRVALTSEGGWDGAAGRAAATAQVEAALLPRASVFTSVEIGGLTRETRPAIGAAVQLRDPRDGHVGARISVAYRPEGFSEPEGEIESVVVVSRVFGADALRGLVAYGQDPEGRESDAELGISFLHRASQALFVGATARTRFAIALKVGEPRWDTVAGGVGGVAFGHSRVELLVGADSVAYSAVSTGVVALVSVGTSM
jgi:hypothetical protein